MPVMGFKFITSSLSPCYYIVHSVSARTITRSQVSPRSQWVIIVGLICASDDISLNSGNTIINRGGLASPFIIGRRISWFAMYSY